MIDFQFLEVPELNLSYVQNWFEHIVEHEGKILGELSVVLGTDEWLL